MKPKQAEPEVMNANEAARYLGLSRMTLRKYLATIPHRRAGTRLLFRKAALDFWLEGRDDVREAA